jgi:hypothetical protein
VGKDVLTPDEIIATLQRSALPTILVEGPDDVVIYRWVEAKIAATNADVLPCGGRPGLLSVFERRHEFPHAKVTFIADRDMWVFCGVPPAYKEIVFTDGYSIENDLYAAAPLESLLEPAEEVEFRRALDVLIDWFSFEVEQYLAGLDAHVDCHPNEIAPPGSVDLSPNFIAQRRYRKPDPTTVHLIKTNYQRLLRGKILFQLLARYLSAPGRRSKFSIKNLHELGFKMASHSDWIDRMIAEVQAALS